MLDFKYFEPFLLHCSDPFVIKSCPIQLYNDQIFFIIFQQKLVFLFLIKLEFCSPQYDILQIIRKKRSPFHSSHYIRSFVLKFQYDNLLITVLTAVLRAKILSEELQICALAVQARLQWGPDHDYYHDPDYDHDDDHDLEDEDAKI